jgi:hypothetical protein
MWKTTRLTWGLTWQLSSGANSRLGYQQRPQRFIIFFTRAWAQLVFVVRGSSYGLVTLLNLTAHSLFGVTLL